MKIMILMMAIWMTVESAQAMELLLSPKPQGNTKTCQSYALAFALGQDAGTAVDIDTTATLRAIELSIRSEIEAIAQAENLSPQNHRVWKKTIEAVTQNRYTLKLQYISELQDFYQKIADATGNRYVGSLALASAIFAKQPVMTSVMRVAGDRYASGHIVTVLGVNLPKGNLSSTRLQPIVLLNSAIKTADKTKNSCQPDDLIGDYRYSASVSLYDDYELKTYAGKYLLMWIEKYR